MQLLVGGQAVRRGAEILLVGVARFCSNGEAWDGLGSWRREVEEMERTAVITLMLFSTE